MTIETKRNKRRLVGGGWEQKIGKKTEQEQTFAGNAFYGESFACKSPKADDIDKVAVTF